MTRRRRKNKPGAGRPPEGREVLFLRVLPETGRLIREDRRERETLGRVVDRWARQLNGEKGKP